MRHAPVERTTPKRSPLREMKRGRRNALLEGRDGQRKLHHLNVVATIEGRKKVTKQRGMWKTAITGTD